MTSITVCRTGTNDLAARLEDTSVEFSEVKIVGQNPAPEIKVLRNEFRGHFLRVLELDSGEEKPVTLREMDYRRIAELHSLQSLTLQKIDCPASSLRLFTKLTHLTLDSASDEQVGAISCLTNLTSLHLGSTLEERQIRWLFNLKKLTALICPFRFSRPLQAPLTLATTFPALRRVEVLPQSPPLTFRRIQEFFRMFQYEPASCLKRLFSLQDSKGNDLFHYCREALEGEDPDLFDTVLRYVNNETTSEEQLLQWLDYSLTSPCRLIFEKVLSLQVDVNRFLPGKELALVVAVQGATISRTGIFDTLVEKLLAKGANPSLGDGFGNNPLIIATKALRSHLVKKLLSTTFTLNATLLSTVLDYAIGLGIEFSRQDPKKANHAFSIAKAVCRKGLPDKGQCLTEQLERVLKCKVPVPAPVVLELLKAGAKSNVKNHDNNTALNELLREISAMDKEKSKDRELWEVKLGYFKAIVENGDDRITNYKHFLDIARVNGILSVIPFLQEKVAAQKASPTK